MATATRPTVLSVDDEAGIRDAICLELEDDFDVVTTASGMQLGAADYVTKPWEHGEVVVTIHGSCERSTPRPACCSLATMRPRSFLWRSHSRVASACAR